MAQEQLAFYVDLDSCTGCKACQIACKDKNDLDLDIMWRRVLEYSGGDWTMQGEAWLTTAFAYSVPVSCMHCEEPPCVDVCPSGGLTKRDADGVVLIDQDKCLGCRYCEWSCPYGAMQYDSDAGKMTKCDFCADYLAEGLAPACVDACPMRALDYGPLEELRAKYGDLDEVAPLPEAALSSPAVVFGPHREARPAGSDAGRVSNLEEV